MLFLDETSVILGHHYKRRCWRKKNQVIYEERPKQYIIRYIKFCGLIGIDGPIYIEKLNGKFTSEVYIKFLRNSIVNNGLESKTIICDNDTRHQSLKTRNFLNENRIKYLEGYPPESADLNIIEHVWAVIKKNVYKKPIPVSLKELEEKFIREFYNINITFIRNMYFSMKRRLEKIILSKGFPTKY